MYISLPAETEVAGAPDNIEIEKLNSEDHIEAEHEQISKILRMMKTKTKTMRKKDILMMRLMMIWLKLKMLEIQK